MVKQSKSQTQQSQSQHEGYKIADEVLDENLILRCWKGVEDQVNRVRKFNRSQNLPNIDNYIGYIYDGISRPPMSVGQKIRWLNITTQKKSGVARTVDHLIASGQISDIEKEVFGQGKWPRIECHTMTRVKTIDNKEYLVRGMRGYGLSEIGAIVTLPLYDCDFTRKVPISADIAKDKDGNDVKILTVGSGEFSYETSQKTYLTPFTTENVLSVLEKYPQSEDNDLHGKMTYTFKKEGTSLNEVQVSGLDEFLTDDFDETFERIRQPAPQININSKDLAAFVKMDRESRTEHKQYS